MKKIRTKAGAILLFFIMSVGFTGCFPEYEEYIWRMGCAYPDPNDIDYIEGNTTSFEVFNEMKEHCLENGGIPGGSRGN